MAAVKAYVVAVQRPAFTQQAWLVTIVYLQGKLRVKKQVLTEDRPEIGKSYMVYADNTVTISSSYSKANYKFDFGGASAKLRDHFNQTRVAYANG